MKTKSNTSKTNTLKKCQTRPIIPIDIILNFLEKLPLPPEYKTKHLLDFAYTPDWMQRAEPVSLNAINVQQMPFTGSSDVLPWNYDDDNPVIDIPLVAAQDVKVLRVNTKKFTSDAADDDLPQAVHILDSNTPTVDEPALIDVKAVALAVDPADAYDNNDVRAQFDSGADATVTNLRVYLHDYKPYNRKFKCPVRLTGAVGSTDVFPLGEGKLHVPAPVPSGYIAIRCFYSPHLSSTLISPRDVLKTGKQWNKDFTGQDMCSYFPADGDPNFGNCVLTCHHRLRKSQNIVVEGVGISGNKYTHPLIAPELPANHPGANSYNSKEYALKNDPDFVQAVNVAAIETAVSYQEHQLNLLEESFLPDTSSLDTDPFKQLIMQYIPIRKIKADTLRILWHQRLGHPCDEYLYSAHKWIDGVPKFKRRFDVLSCCSTCIQAKQTKNAPGPNSTQKAMHLGQVLSIDFAFSGVTSKSLKRRQDYMGINGETCWVLVSDHFTGIQWGAVRRSKASPIEWLCHFLLQNSPTCKDKYVYLDQGGELYGNPDIKNLFANWHYEILPTGVDASHQNGPVERAHRSVGDHVRALLEGAALDIKF